LTILGDMVYNVGMPFTRSKEGRPCGTGVVDLKRDGGEPRIIHYTCNSPDDEVLKKHNIMSIGRAFNVEPREVLLIPINLMAGRGYPGDTAGVEHMLRDLK